MSKGRYRVAPATCSFPLHGRHLAISRLLAFLRAYVHIILKGLEAECYWKDDVAKFSAALEARKP